MGKRVVMACLLCGVLRARLGGEPPRPGPGMPDPAAMEARRRHAEMMRLARSLPGVPPHVIQFWQDAYPETLEELRHRLGEQPHERGEIARRIAEETGHLAEMRERDPERFDLVLQQRRLDRTTHHLGARIRKAEEQAEKERLAGELRATLPRLLEVREALRDREIQDVEGRLAELKALAAKRRAHKTEIINHRVKELSGELDYLRW